jgi:Fe-S cluster biogenesis protein NfuA
MLGVEEGVARLRLHGSCNGCPSSTATLKLAIEDAIQRAAPDVEGIEAEGAVEPGLLQIEIACPVPVDGR